MKVYNIFILLILLTSCYRGYFPDGQKQREKNGNDLSFVYFKSIPYSEYLFKQGLKVNDTLSTKILLRGGTYEVTNGQYWRFLNSIKDSNYQAYLDNLPYDEAWEEYRYIINDFTDTLKALYNDFEKSKNYPVVNITPNNMKAYLSWLNKIEPNPNVRYRMFTAEEWLDLFNCSKDPNDSTFAWGTNYWRNKANSLLGNFAMFDQNQIRFDILRNQVKFAHLDSIGYQSRINGPLSVYSYNPNCYGAWNMSGNVAELTAGYPNAGSYYTVYRDSIHWSVTTHGGSWISPVYYLRKGVTENYKIPSPFVGFRVLQVEIFTPPNKK